MNSNTALSDLIVFSHLRWDFVFQRPQHLMIRHASERRVYFVEEPIIGVASSARLHVRETEQGIKVVVPYLPSGLEGFDKEQELRFLIDDLLSEDEIETYTSLYYSPMFLPFTRHLEPVVTIYDCMDELSKFQGAPSNLIKLEAELFNRADLVFTGGQSLFEAKKQRHGNIHPLPSAIDFKHFSQARAKLHEPKDQAAIPHPRIGYFGVIDERMDLKLIDELARLKPAWQLVMIGPVLKIDESELPRRPNIHYLGMKDYQELPLYLSGWNLAMMPFARNEATRFISPTKTPEYLAAGRPVVSTSIRDVVKPYGTEKLVYIADRPVDFIACAERAMEEQARDTKWLKKVDEFLAGISWDQTWQRMIGLENDIYRRKARTALQRAVKREQFSTDAGLA